MRRTHALLAALILAGCAPKPAPAPPGPDRALLARTVAMAAAQIQRCYRTPRIPREGRQITVVLRVRYGLDGMLTGLPELLAQRGVSPDNQAYATRMTEAATLAVIRCAPLRLPPETYQGGWDEFELTFSPRAVA